MPEQDVGDKQFEATPHKLREAHKKGQIYKSRDITQLLTFIVGFFMIYYGAPFIYENFLRLFNLLWSQIPYKSLSTIGAGYIFFHSWYCLVIILLPLLLGLLITAVGVEFL